MQKQRRRSPEPSSGQNPPATIERPPTSRKEWEAQRMEEVERRGHKNAYSNWKGPKPSGPPR
jgi:hypothetical protein